MCDLHRTSLSRRPLTAAGLLTAVAVGPWGRVRARRRFAPKRPPTGARSEGHHARGALARLLDGNGRYAANAPRQQGFFGRSRGAGRGSASDRLHRRLRRCPGRPGLHLRPGTGRPVRRPRRRQLRKHRRPRQPRIRRVRPGRPLIPGPRPFRMRGRVKATIDVMRTKAVLPAISRCWSTRFGPRSIWPRRPGRRIPSPRPSPRTSGTPSDGWSSPGRSSRGRRAQRVKVVGGFFDIRHRQGRAPLRGRTRIDDRAGALQ